MIEFPDGWRDWATTGKMPNVLSASGKLDLNSADESEWKPLSLTFVEYPTGKIVRDAISFLTSFVNKMKYSLQKPGLFSKVSRPYLVTLCHDNGNR